MVQKQQDCGWGANHTAHPHPGLDNTQCPGTIPGAFSYDESASRIAIRNKPIDTLWYDLRKAIEELAKHNYPERELAVWVLFNELEDRLT